MRDLGHGHLSLEELIQRNTRKTLATMNILSSVGVNPSGFSKLLCTRFYAHIVRPQLEYGLTINHFTVSQLHALEEVQNNCNKKIYEPDTRSLKNLEIRQRCRNSKLLSSCRRSTSLDPILWLPMSKSECSRCIRWRLGWLPGGQTSIICLDMHRRLFMLETIRDPLPFLLNMLSLCPSVPPNLALTWYQRWPIICSLLHELDQLHHNKLISTKYPHGQKFLVWLK
ncbi:hypothetical protein BCV72DRAFT_251175 [Rhizopus microsporus var. microsporus]|uniref:Uncharacterized protein n=1 Tax=Rhizopus microsporus var. microsporus TaxID=86635 RepID=A0A1X0QXS9_RHIZD|nr:hypothetical protein BCV72DRAFT_251175 [Rhizopus microsporus var. microsporus]